MKKQMYLAVCLIVAGGGGNCLAQPRHVVVPGFGLSELPPAETTIQTHETAPAYRHEAPPRRVQREQAQTHEEDRLLKWSRQSGNSEKFIVTRSYDKYGWTAREEYSSGMVKTIDYSWVQPGKVWDKCTVTLALSSGTDVQTTTRTFHANGNVKTEDYRGGGVVDRYEYDEDGYCVYSKRCGADGEIIFENTWKKFTPFGSDVTIWLQDYTDNILEPARRETYTIAPGSNYYVRLAEEKQGGEWVKYQETYSLFNMEGWQSGNVWVDYNNGVPEIMYGYFTEFPVPGEDTYTIYSGSYTTDGTWVINNKTEYSNNYPLLTDPEKHPQECYSIMYNNEGPYLKTTYSYFKGDFVKETRTYLAEGMQGKTTTSYYRLNAETRRLETIYYDESTGNYALTSSAGGTLTDFVYYDAQGNEYLRMRGDYSLEVVAWLVWNGSEWVKLTQNLDVMNYSFGFDYMGRTTFYVQRDEHGNVVYNYEVSYDGDGGYTMKSYYPRDNGKVGQVTVCTAAGVITRDSYSYDADGNVRSINRLVTDTATGIIDSYSWSPATGEWTHMYASISDYKETLADGTMVTIYRTIDLDHNITNRTKTELWIDGLERIESRYLWDIDAGKWVPTDRTATMLYPAGSFEYHEPEAPELAVEDYFTITSRDEEEEGARKVWTVWYGWDASRGDWYVNSSTDPESKVEGNTLYIYYDNSSYRSRHKYTVDDRRNVVDYAVDDVYPDGTVVPQQSVKNDYDAKGRLVRSDADYGIRIVKEYEYGPVTIFSGIDEIESGAEEAGSYTVYNMQGMQLLREAPAAGLLTLPEGLYIVNGKKMRIGR